MDKLALQEDLTYWRQESTQWTQREKTMTAQIAALESELNASLNNARALQLRLESTQQKHQLLIERQAESASSNARELANLQAECLRLKDDLISTKAQMLELEQANIRHQENERAALATLSDIQAKANAADARCHSLTFELEAGRKALEELRQLREENTDLKADLELYAARLKRYEEEDSSTYGADFNDFWERDQLRKSPIQGTIRAWADNNFIFDNASKVPKPRTS